jgi:beta-hydroxylase
MSVAVVLAVFAIASIVYVYRFRGEVRYASFGEYVRKGWPIFSPFNCVLYMTTLPRAAKPIIDPAEFPELDALRVNWRDIRDEGRMLASRIF